jgi:hypothetical protein
MVPKPCLALLFLYPLTEKILGYQDKKIKEGMSKLKKKIYKKQKKKKEKKIEKNYNKIN